MQISTSIQRKIGVATGVAGALAASVSPAFAQTITLQPPSGVGFFTSGQDLITKLLNIVMVVGVLLVFAYLVMGGIEYITSGGEKGKTEAARNKITSAVIGLIILAASYAILTIALKFLGTSTENVFNSF